MWTDCGTISTVYQCVCDSPFTISRSERTNEPRKNVVLVVGFCNHRHTHVCKPKVCNWNRSHEHSHLSRQSPTLFQKVRQSSLQRSLNRPKFRHGRFRYCLSTVGLFHSGHRCSGTPQHNHSTLHSDRMYQIPQEQCQFRCNRFESLYQHY